MYESPKGMENHCWEILYNKNLFHLHLKLYRWKLIEISLKSYRFERNLVKLSSQLVTFHLDLLSVHLIICFKTGFKSWMLLHLVASYGNWSEYTQCNATCGGGYQSRERECSLKAPNKCVGEPIMFRRCNEMPCAGRHNIELIYLKSINFCVDYFLE